MDARNIFSKIKDRYHIYRYLLPFFRQNQLREISEKNTICIFSFMRSGSSWFADLLKTIPNTCLFDEPLFIDPISDPSKMPEYSMTKLREISSLNFYFYQPIPEGVKWREAESFFFDLLKGKLGTLHLLNRNDLHKLKDSKTFVFQFNQANLLVHWLKERFDFKSIFLLRNPYATISSILKYPPAYISEEMIQDIRIPSFRFNEVYLKYEHIYKKIVTIEEYFSFLWCINVKEGPLKSGNESCVVFYEDILTEFDKEMDRIFAYLQRPVPESTHHVRWQPSMSTMPKSVENIYENRQLHSWQKRLSSEQKKRIAGILDRFEIAFYNESPLPDRTKFLREFSIRK